MPYKTKEEQRAYQNAWVQKRRSDWITENGPCSCGSYDGLEVDHIDPSLKTLHPREIWSRREEVRLKELANCQVLCYDCHKGKTAIDLSLIFTKHPAHGTINRYKKGCRCEPCSEALRVYWRNRRARKEITFQSSVNSSTHGCYP